MPQIKLTDIVVRYQVYTTARQRSLLGIAANKASFGRIARDAGKIPVVTALNGLSVSLKDGDRLALIGRNGAGKSTLLKVCGGLILPSSGTAEITGTRATLLNQAAALDPDKTGADNVEAIGRLFGLSRERRAALFADVAEFTELGEFLNLPIRAYSSGMTVRLSFALATSVERDILIVDEVIGAGDALFVEKAAKRVRAMFDRAKILVLASHAGHILTQLCNRALWIDGGKAVLDGNPTEVWDAYINQRLPGPHASAKGAVG